MVTCAVPLMACASSSEGAERTAAGDGAREHERISEHVAERVTLAANLSEEPTPGPAPAPEPGPKTEPEPAKPNRPPLSEEAKKKIEEYKALALKNDCSKGFQRLDGTWRFVGETRTPNYSDTLVITGTRFKETMSGNPDGRYLKGEIEGEVRCLFKNRILVELDKVEPEGAYGNYSGDLYPCDLLSDMDPKVDRMLMICYFDWDLRTAAGLEFEFERVEEKP